MRIVFFGTPEFALPSLQALLGSQHTVLAVVTAPDKPRGRGKQTLPTPIAQAAERIGLTVYKPENLKDEEFLKQLRGLKANAFAVVAFRILPEEIYAMPASGAINLHASLLPQYRGPAPIQWALMNGARETGVTTFRIEKRVDTGNLLKQRKVEILDEDDAGALGKRLALVGAQLLVETLNDLESGALVPQPQDHQFATIAPKIAPEDCLINWRKTASCIHNQVRALAPQPGAYSYFEGQILKLYRTRICEIEANLDPGDLLISDSALIVGAGKGTLEILSLQLQGKNRLEAKDFLRGFRSRGIKRLMNSSLSPPAHS